MVSLHILARLADSDGKPLRSEDLAASANTNAVVIRNLLARMAGAGLIRTQMGSGGGALLARAAETISLLDVYGAVEDREMFSFHRSPPADRLTVDRYIVPSLVDILADARQALELRLAAVTIRDVLADIRRREEIQAGDPTRAG